MEKETMNNTRIRDAIKWMSPFVGSSETYHKWRVASVVCEQIMIFQKFFDCAAYLCTHWKFVAKKIRTKNNLRF